MSLLNLLNPKRLQDIKYTLELAGEPQELSNEEIMDRWRAVFIPGARSTGAFHPSEVASGYVAKCDRRLYYGIAKAPIDVTHLGAADTDNQLQRIFDLGTMLHLYIQATLYDMGLLDSFETPVKDNKLKISGHADGVMKAGVLGLPKDKKAVLEIKSINTFGFVKLKAPKPEHIKQASIYAEVLGIDLLYFIYYDKNNSSVKDYIVPIDVRFVRKFKDTAAGLVKMLKKNLMKRGDNIPRHEVPNRVCPMKSHKTAIDCQYSDICFKTT